MRINDNSRPKEITSDEIWEVYKLLESLDEHYVFYDRCGAPKNRDELFYLAGTAIGDDGMVYEAIGRNIFNVSHVHTFFRCCW